MASASSRHAATQPGSGGRGGTHSRRNSVEVVALDRLFSSLRPSMGDSGSSSRSLDVGSGGGSHTSPHQPQSSPVPAAGVLKTSRQSPMQVDTSAHRNQLDSLFTDTPLAGRTHEDPPSDRNHEGGPSRPQSSRSMASTVRSSKAPGDPPSFSEMTVQAREAMAPVIASPWFEALVIALIIANTIFLALVDPTDPESPRTQAADAAESVFLVAFTLEALLKAFVLGWYGKPTAYLADWWNRLDFGIVVLSWLALLPMLEGTNLSAVRVVRIFRLLRSVTSLSGLRLLIDAFTSSVPQLVNVAVLCAFCFFLFGIVGVQLFGGKLNQRCFFPSVNGSAPVLNEDDERMCDVDGVDGGRSCPVVGGVPTVCMHSHVNPNRGITSFDNTLVAFLAIFQCISLEGWVDMQYWMRDTMSGWYGLYFVVLILFGSLFLLNLVVAVITLNLTSQSRQAVTETKRAEQWATLARLQAAGSTGDVLSALIAASYAVKVGADARAAAAAVAKTRKGRALVRSHSAHHQHNGHHGNHSNHGNHGNHAAGGGAAADDGAGAGAGHMNGARSAGLAGRVSRHTMGSADSQLHLSHLFTTSTNDMPEATGSGLAEAPHASPPAANARGANRGRRGGLRRPRSSRRGSAFAPGPAAPTPEIDKLLPVLKHDQPAEGASPTYGWQRVTSSVGRALRASRARRVRTTLRFLHRAWDGLFRLAPGLVPAPAPLDGTPESSRTQGDDVDATGLGAPAAVVGDGMLAQRPPSGAFTPGTTVSNRPMLRVDTPDTATPPPPASLESPVRRSTSRASRASFPSDSSSIDESEMPPSLRTPATTHSNRAGINATAADELARLDALLPAATVRRRRADRRSAGSSAGAGSGGGDGLSSVAETKGDNEVHVTFVDSCSSSGGDSDGHSGATSYTVDEPVLDDEDERRAMRMRPDQWSPLWRWVAYTISTSSLFAFIIYVLILLNTVLLAVEHHRMDQSTKDALEVMNVVLTAMFAFEMFVKIAGLTLEGYLADNFNRFDCVIVIISLIELSVQSGGGVSALRTFRLMRVFKLARGWTGFNLLLQRMVSAIPRIGPLTLVLGIIMLMYSLIGMQFFGGTLRDSDGDVPRANYDTLFWAFVTTFQIITGENWNEVMYDAVASTSWFASIYFVSLVIIGNYVVLTLFLAILIDHFQNNDEPDDDEALKQPLPSDHLGLLGARPDVATLVQQQRAQHEHRTNLAKVVAQALEQEQAALDRSRQFQYHPSHAHGSLFTFGADSKFRQLCAYLVLHKYFEWVIMALITFSCVLLAIDSPTASSQVRDTVQQLDIVVTIAFIIEALLKIVAFGLVAHDGAYLRDGWNAFDFFIVVVSLLNYVLAVDVRALKALRSMRALRALRLVRSLEGLRLVANSLIQAIQPCLNLAAISALFFLIFAILGVAFFGGRFHKCTDESRECFPEWTDDCPPELACTGMWTPPDATAPVQREWVNPSYSTAFPFSFDNVAVGMMTLFEVASLELWLDVMYAAADSRSEGWGPKRDANYGASLFFVAFIIVASLFMLNLFVSVVVETFSKIKADMLYPGSVFQTEGQRHWVEMQRRLLYASAPAKLDPPANRFRSWCFRAATSNEVEKWVMGAIFVNVLIMALRRYDMSSSLSTFVDTCNVVFGAIFLIEIIVRMVGLGWRQFFSSSRWNSFDLAIVVINVVAQVVEWSVQADVVDVNILRVFRAVRIVRIVKTSPRLRSLFKTLILSLPSLGNVGTLLLLLLFVYSVAGMNMFGTVAHGEFITVHANFESFPSSMLLMSRMITGESWNGLMHDCTEATGPIVAIAFFFSFVVLGQFIVLNMFVAVILENFEREMASESADQMVKPADLENFQEVWSRNHPRNLLPRQERKSKSMEWMPVAEFIRVLCQVGTPLGLPPAKIKSRSAIMRMLRILDVPVNANGEVHYALALRACVRRVCGENLPSDLDQLEHGPGADALLGLPRPWIRLGPQLVDHTAAQVHAAAFAQARFRFIMMLKKRRLKRAQQRRKARRHHQRRLSALLSPPAHARRPGRTASNLSTMMRLQAAGPGLKRVPVAGAPVRRVEGERPRATGGSGAGRLQFVARRRSSSSRQRRGSRTESYSPRSARSRRDSADTAGDEAMAVPMRGVRHE